MFNKYLQMIFWLIATTCVGFTQVAAFETVGPTMDVVPNTIWEYQVQRNLQVPDHGRILFTTSTFISAPGVEMKGHIIDMIVTLDTNLYSEVWIQIRDGSFQPGTKIVARMNGEPSSSRIDKWMALGAWTNNGRPLLMAVERDPKLTHDQKDEILDQLKSAGENSRHSFMQVEIKSPNPKNSFEVKFPIFNFAKAFAVGQRAIINTRR